MRRRTLLGTAVAAAATATLGPRPAGAQADPDAAVDVLLVLAVDVSRSIDADEARLQRDGYRNAIAHPRVIEAVRGGVIGAIGLAYVEWSGAEQQRLVHPWTRIAGMAEAEAWARALNGAPPTSGALDRAPRISLGQTSISGAIDFSRRVLAQAPWRAARRVVDVSGDGVNNSGAPAEEARDRAVAEGITVNGLAIVNEHPTYGVARRVPLDEYYRESVIGGPGAFLVLAEAFESFGVAVRRKLIWEISDLPPPRRTAAQATLGEPRQ
jgi:hypothetical protein